MMSCSGRSIDRELFSDDDSAESAKFAVTNHKSAFVKLANAASSQDSQEAFVAEKYEKRAENTAQTN